jgi:hypothetical protein
VSNHLSPGTFGPPALHEPDELVRYRARRIRSRERSHRHAHGLETSWITEELGNELGHTCELPLIERDRPSAPLEVMCIERLVIGRRMRMGDENRRGTCGGEAPRPFPAREIARSATASASPK